MTPAQQVALEALAGRALTADEASQIDAMTAAGSIGTIAAMLSAGRTTYATTRKVEIGLIGSHPGGPVAADALLAKLEAYAEAGQPLSRLVGRALKAMAVEPGLNLGDPSTHAMLSALVAQSVITADEAEGLMDIARVPDPLPRDAISRALNKATS